MTMLIQSVIATALFLLGQSSGADHPHPPHRVGNCNNGNDLVTTLPNLKTAANKVPTVQYAGYVETNETTDGHLFYWFMEALNPDDSGSDIPLVLWLNGGPGASSLNGLYFENGMYQLNDDLTVDLKDASQTWSDKYHMIFWDNPVGTGYSYCNEDGYVTNEDQMGEQFVKGMLAFYDCHPEYSSNPLYITGESYAGRYLPFIAKWMIKSGNLPLKGVAIGDGIYDPYIQFPSAAEYAYHVGLLDDQEYNYVQSQVNYGLYNVSQIDNDTAADIVVNITNDIYSVYAGNIFQYDVRETNGHAFDDLGVTLNDYSNLDLVKDALHTSGHTFADSDGTSSPNPVYNALKYDIVQNNSAIIVQEILDAGIPMLFYNGQFDGSICNNLGNQRCLNQLNYKGLWLSAPKKPVFTVNSDGQNQTIGYVKILPNPYKLLTYFVVSNSGHLVPMNQPENSKYMVETWIQNSEWY